jgi:predicted nucleotidyltransferase
MTESHYPAASWQVAREEIIAVLQNIAGLNFAILYGSAGVGEPFRDLDIALAVDRTVQPKAGDLDLAFAVSEALEARLPWPIDVRVINDAPLPFSYNVSKGEPLLLNEPEAYYTWLERTWDMWFDFKPIADQYLRDLA